MLRLFLAQVARTEEAYPVFADAATETKWVTPDVSAPA